VASCPCWCVEPHFFFTPWGGPQVGNLLLVTACGLTSAEACCCCCCCCYRHRCLRCPPPPPLPPLFPPLFLSPSHPPPPPHSPPHLPSSPSPPLVFSFCHSPPPLPLLLLILLLLKIVFKIASPNTWFWVVSNQNFTDGFLFKADFFSRQLLKTTIFCLV